MRARRRKILGRGYQNAPMTSNAADNGARGGGFIGRLLKYVLILMLVGALLFAGGAWYFSGVIGSDALSVDPAQPEYVTTVDRSGTGTVSLLPNDTQPETGKAGVFGLRWSDGWGQLGAIIDGEGASTVTRRYSAREGGTPADGTLTDVNSTVYIGNPRQALGLEYLDVPIPGELGPMPAYLVPAPRSTWVIYVHGKGSTREEGYRALSTLQPLGYPGLLITYRNDVGAPQDPSGEYGYGLREWKDLESAVAYSLANGADDVVLAGWSMGGAIVGQFLERSPLAERVTGLLLDSPALDMPAAIELGASQRSLPLVGLPIPAALTSAALWTSDRRFPTDLSSAVTTDSIKAFAGPVMVAQGSADETTPPAVSDDVVAARTQAKLPTRYLRIDDAGHVESWNVARERYIRALTTFTADLAR